MRWKCSFIAAIALAAVLVGGCASTRDQDATAVESAEPSPALTAEQQADNLASFDEIWQTVRDKHWDPDLVGAEWDAARDELRPQVAEATTMREARRTMNELLGRLQQSHFGVIPADAYEAIEDEPADGGHSAGTRGEGDAGVALRIENGRALVTFVHPDGSAAGLIEPGWWISAIQGVDTDSLIAAVRKNLVEADRDEKILDLLLVRTVMNRLSGDRGDTVLVDAIAADDRPVTVALPLGDPPGESVGLGNLPAQAVWVLDRTLDGDVGYVRFNWFLDPVRVMGGVERAIAAHEDAAGFVIDLRGNLGGIGAMAMGIAGFLVSEPNQHLGTMHTRDMDLKFVVNPRRPRFDGPVAVLVDGLSVSTSEILAGGLQDLGRARIFGTPTAGAALPSIIARLPNGDGFQYAFANYVSTGGDVLEGRGVQPDQVVPLDRDALLQGTDPVIQAAVEWIRRERSKG